MKFITPSKTATKTTIRDLISGDYSRNKVVYTIYTNIEYNYYVNKQTSFFGESIRQSFADIFKCLPTSVFIFNNSQVSYSTTNYINTYGSSGTNGPSQYGTKLEIFIIPSNMSDINYNYDIFTNIDIGVLIAAFKYNGMPDDLMISRNDPSVNSYNLILSTSYSSPSTAYSNNTIMFINLQAIQDYIITFVSALNIIYSRSLINTINGGYPTSILTSKYLLAINNFWNLTTPTPIPINLLQVDIIDNTYYTDGSLLIYISINNNIVYGNTGSPSLIRSNLLLQLIYSLYVHTTTDGVLNEPAIGAQAVPAFITELIKVGFPNDINSYYQQQTSGPVISYFNILQHFKFNIIKCDITNTKCTITAPNPSAIISNTIVSYNIIYYPGGNSSLYTIVFNTPFNDVPSSSIHIILTTNDGQFATIGNFINNSTFILNSNSGIYGNSVSNVIFNNKLLFSFNITYLYEEIGDGDSSFIKFNTPFDNPPNYTISVFIRYLDNTSQTTSGIFTNNSRFNTVDSIRGDGNFSVLFINSD